MSFSKGDRVTFDKSWNQFRRGDVAYVIDPTPPQKGMVRVARQPDGEDFTFVLADRITKH